MSSNNFKKIIEVKNFTKDYGSNRGVFDVSFVINKGQFFGFLGPNGAGKSTTIRHLMGFSKPDKGSLKINGQDTFKYHSQLMKDVGYLPGEINLPTFLKGREFLNEIKKFRKNIDHDYLNSLLKLFPIDLNEEIKSMSFGDKRKLAIIVAFMHNPSILILDEPTSGLDAISQDNFLNFLIAEKSKGKTILLSSHILREVEKTCDYIAIIKDGKIVSQFDKSLFNIENKNSFKIYFNTTFDIDYFLEKIGKNIKIINICKDDCSVSVKADDDSLSDLFFVLSDNYFHFNRIEQEGESLENFFLSFYKRKI